MSTQSCTLDLTKVFGHEGFPEEIATNILGRLDDSSLLRCTQTCRLLNQLSVHHAMERAGNWHPTDFCHFSIGFEDEEKPEPIDFFLVSVHMKSFTHVVIVFDIQDPHAITYRLKRLALFFERAENIISFTLNFERFENTATYYRNEGTSPLEDALENVLNAVISKSCMSLQLSNELTHHTIEGYRFDMGTDKPLSSGSITTDESRYVAHFNLEEYEEHDDEVISQCRSLRYAPSQPSQLKMLAINFDFLRPPFSEWVFFLVQQSPVTHFSISLLFPFKKQSEYQFILHRLATAASSVEDLSFYLHVQHPFPDFVPHLNFFSKTLTGLTLQAEYWHYSKALEHLELELPELTSLKTTPSVFAALLSKPKKPPHLPKLNLVTLSLLFLDEQDQFELIQFAAAVLKAKKLQRSQDDSSSESRANLPSLPSDIVFGARLRFDSRFKGLTREIRDGTPPDLGSEELSNALAKFSRLEVRFPGRRVEIQNGNYKEELLALLTVFPGTEVLQVTSKERASNVPFHDAVFKSLKLRCPSLVDAKVG